MKLRWTTSALVDLTRFDSFLAPLNEKAAIRVRQALRVAAERLLEHPRIGYRLDEFGPREIRRIIVGSYELRYEIADDTIFVMRIWHTREDR
jgi:plasmid stabilization system protein ParE